MAHSPADRWVWDLWLAHDDHRWHLFHLQADRALPPEDRHWHASIGHAVSDDLVSWAPQPTALETGPAGAWDELTLWTGSVLRHRSGRWLMAYTGLRREDGAVVERVGLAWSDDLLRWEKDPANPVCETDPRWYEAPGDTTWPHGWRDPFLFEREDGYAMLLSARVSGTGDPHRRGAVALATADDAALGWTVHPPLDGTTGLTAELEVPHLVDGALVASTKLGRGWNPTDERPTWGGLVCVDHGVLRPILGDERCSVYAGRVVGVDDGHVVLGFHDTDETGRFVGGVTDPIPIKVPPGASGGASNVEVVSNATTTLMMRPDPGPSPRAR